MTPLQTPYARRRPMLMVVASLLAALMLLTLWLPRMAHAATIVVDTTDAGTVTNGECSLAEAILAANTNSVVDTCAAGDDAPVDTVVLGADLTYTLPVSYATYLEPVGLPSITSTVVISGNDATIMRDSSAHFGLLYVADSGDLTLHDLTLRNGHAITNGGALTNEGVLTLINSAAISNAATYGGAIATISGTTTLSNTQVFSNAAKYGGGLYSLASDVALVAAQVNHNQSATQTGYGGGIFNQDSTVTLTATEVISNVAGEYESYGGGIYNDHTTITITNSLIQDNEASDVYGEADGGRGGGIYDTNQSVGMITDSSIDQNKATFGGGLYTEQSTLILNNVDLTANLAEFLGSSGDGSGSGAGLYSLDSMVVVNNSRVALNLAERTAGGIHNISGILIISATDILTNTAQGSDLGRDSGGLANAENGQVTLINSRVISNTGGGDAGGIENRGVMTITGTTIALNTKRGTQGAGITNNGQLTITHSSLLSNTVDNPETNSYAVYQEDGSTYIAQSCIVGHQGDYVVANSDFPDGMTIDARNNWWGAPDGPSGEGSGSGDSVGEDVLFSPFLTSPILDCPAIAFLGIGVTKSVNTSNAFVGETITYTYQIVNNGHLTLTTISATDDKLGALPDMETPLAPFATRSVTLTYVVQGSDLPGPLVNTVVVTGTDSLGHTTTATDDASVNLSTSKLAVTVVADRTKVALGGTILYTYRVHNTGLIPITIDAAVDDHTGAIDELLGMLAPGAERTATRSYFVSPSDAPGPIVNRVVVTATDAFDSALMRSSQDSVEIVEPVIEASIIADRSHVGLNGNILYTYRVRNQGVVPITISGAFADHTGQVDDLAGPLSPGSERRAKYTYKAGERDLPGPIVNSLVVTGTDGVSNTYTSNAAISINVSVGDGSPPFVVLLTANKSHVKVGNTVIYTYRVINTGTSAFIINSAVDNRVGVISGLVGTLVAGGTRTATVSYIVKEGDQPGPIQNEVVVTVTRNDDSNVGSASATVNVGGFTQSLPSIYR